MSLFRKVLLGIGGLLILLALVAYLLPRNVHVERSTVIAAPRATVFTIVNSFTHFNKWSPWAELDPTAKYTYEGPVAGVGARMIWVGDPSTMGSGSQIITASTPWESVTTDIDFGPQGIATGRFTLTAQGPATHVVWTLDTDLGMNPVSRYFGLMFDGMIGRDFEKGLAGLRKLAEGLPKGDFADLQIEVVTVTPVTIAYLPASSGKDDASIAAAIAKAYGEVGAFMKAQKLNLAGAPITIDTGASDTGLLFDAAIPIDKPPAKAIAADSRVQVRQTYGGKVLKVALKGPYSLISSTYNKIIAYIAAHGIETNGNSWDEFANDPTTVKESEILTNIYFPIK
jgi:effector-binding domain-containing protein